MASPTRVRHPATADQVRVRTVRDAVADLAGALQTSIATAHTQLLLATPAVAGAAGAGGPALSLSAGRGDGARRAHPRPGPDTSAEPQSVGTVERESRPAAGEADTGDIEAAHAETWELVRAAQAGDGEAFGQLYDRYFDAVYRFIFFRVNDHALAEDFTSETFLRALRRIRSITYQGRDIGAWFMTIARNIVFDHTKSARHRLETTTPEILEGPEKAPSTETAVLASLQSEKLIQAVDSLNAEQRECVVLRFIQGMSVNETATIMGKKDGAIKALQHRAVRKLADIVSPDIS